MIGLSLILIGLLFIFAGFKQKTPLGLIKSFVNPDTTVKVN